MPGLALDPENVYANVIRGFQNPVVSDCLHLRDQSADYAPLSRVVEHVPERGCEPPAVHPVLKRGRGDRGDRDCRGQHLDSCRGDGEIRDPITGRKHGTQFEISRWSDRTALGQASLRHEAGESGEQAQVHHPGDRLGTGRRIGGGDAGRTRLQRQVFLLSGFARAARTPSPRRAASTPPRTITTTATASTACSTTR